MDDFQHWGVYHKIHAPFKRHTEGPTKGRFIAGDWSQPEFKSSKIIRGFGVKKSTDQI